MSCLADDQLEDLAAGVLDDAEVVQLMAHVDACAHCSGRLADCRADLVLAQELQEAFAAPQPSVKGGNATHLPSIAREYLDSHTPDSDTPAPMLWDSTPPADSLPGYQIVREIHRGGQGVVYEAIQLSTQRTVAVKVLLEGPFSGERARWRFEREVKLVARLRHPNIVVIHDSGIAHGRYYFAMEYVRGQPLDTHVRLTNLSIRDVIRLFIKACDAVSYAHRRGVIHRDLKPSNVLVGEDSEPQVLDFGLAKIVGEEMQAARGGLMTQTGQLMGTLRYMAPEQTLGDPEAIDTRTDVYTLGVILYELLTRKTPYETDVDLAAALTNIREADAPRPSQLRREIKQELEAVILKAMHKEPDRRYQSAGELQQDLLAWLEGRPVTAKSDSAFYVLRKLAARHYFHTSVITALVAAIFGFAGVTYHYYQQTKAALEQKILSEKSERMAHKDMAKFMEDGREGLRQQALGWFLLEWNAGRLDRARAIRAQLKNTDTNEYAIMAFLLDGSITPQELRERLPASAEALAHFAAGEWHLRAARTAEAIREFELSIQTARPQYEWYRQSAAARLEQLRPRTASVDRGSPEASLSH